ncbi:phytanoyl-CoA dioxygenase family protein [Paenibacillus koleovorans]|uniref:phytanoyl-CoA dioxygenase family protein n=1 Tax=Paenibacillus koleovorans TaxID=121608 RepID=UPI000FD88274|nr:phytanoyl-CoA dioxygenase family protein [Paenibacillus koleovorans]
MKLTDAAEINRVLYPSVTLADYVDDWNGVGEGQVKFYREKGYLALRNGYSKELIDASGDAIKAMLNDRYMRTREEFNTWMRERRMESTAAETAPAGLEPAEESGESKRVKLPFVQIVKPDGATRIVDDIRPCESVGSFDEYERMARKIGDYVYYDERFYAMAYHPELLRVVEMLLGEKPKLVQDMALLKPPQGGGEKPWHQDMAYRGLDYDRSILGVWIAVDEASVDNGCMHIIPRSHMLGGVPHYAERDWQMCDENVEADRALVAPLDPGGLLFFHGMLHHGTPSNFSTKKRRALQFHYAAESSEMVTPKEYKRMFTNEMSGAQC